MICWAVEELRHEAIHRVPHHGEELAVFSPGVLQWSPGSMQQAHIGGHATIECCARSLACPLRTSSPRTARILPDPGKRHDNEAGRAFPTTEDFAEVEGDQYC